MSWFADLAGKAENLLNNLDEQTGAALRNHNVVKSKKHDTLNHNHQELPWSSKKRTAARAPKKTSIASETKPSNFTPARKPSPTSYVYTRQSRSPLKDGSPEHTNIRKKSPLRKPNTQFNLDHCPRTFVGDMNENENDDHFYFRQRRYSLPTDLELLSNQDLTYKMQNLEVENAMLKNELNVMNREVAELLERLRKTEDELSTTQSKLENSDLRNQQLGLDVEVQNKQLEQLKQKINELTSIDLAKHRERNDSLETEISILKGKNEDLETKLKQLTDKTNENNSIQIKLDTDLRHAQSVISELQANLEKSNAECHRMEKDWEAYKLRVKGMLFAKDNEIKSLQQGISMTEDTRLLVEQLETLKVEREELSAAVSSIRNECDDMKQYIEQLENKHAGAERVVTALRDALRDERAAKNRAEAQYLALGKELKSYQLESGQTIASLRTALRDKENELINLRNTTSSIRTTDTSALNVADYDVTRDSIDSDRIHYLTDTLVQKQNKIDSLLADNNILRIQLEKLESKYKKEVLVARSNHNHVVHLQDAERRSRNGSSLSSISLRINVMMKRYPLFRMFVFIYMIGLHLFVMTVLFTSTPDGHIPRDVKS